MIDGFGLEADPVSSRDSFIAFRWHHRLLPAFHAADGLPARRMKTGLLTFERKPVLMPGCLRNIDHAARDFQSVRSRGDVH